MRYSERGFTVRLAHNQAEIEASQRLRYQVFYEEMGASADAATLAAERDQDPFDDICDHLLVIDERHGGGVVGTYRILRRDVAEATDGFYSADEFDLQPLLRLGGASMEVGRSCVHKLYRTRQVIDLLWSGLAGYVFQHDIHYLFGCASLPGTDRRAITPVLRYLNENHKAPPESCPVAWSDLRVDPEPQIDDVLDFRTAWRHLPPLLKGYLRLGGLIGDGAVLDSQFNTIDVCLVVDTTKVRQSYRRHYEQEHGRAPASAA